MRFAAASLHPAPTPFIDAIEFEIVNGGLVALGTGSEPFDVVIQPFDASSDIFYRSPEPLTADKLTEEIAIHIPGPLHDSIGTKPIISSLGDFVLIQICDPAFFTIPLFAALKKILVANETINSAVLHADHGGIAYIRNAGNEFFGGTTAHSLREFIGLPSSERNSIFPDIHAANILVCGSDVQYFDELQLDAFSSIRASTMADIETLCELTPKARSIVTESPHLFTLTLGAAAAYAEILTSPL